MRKLHVWLIGLFLALGAVTAWSSSDLTVSNAWINEAPPNASALAGYMVIHNGSNKDRVLVAAESRSFGSVMLHRTIVEHGMAKMVHQEKIRVPARGKVTFEPNGYHLMLMKPKQHFTAGNKVKLTLKFENGDTLPVTFEVRRGEGMPMMNHGSENMHH